MKSESPGKGRKTLIFLLIAANVLMLVVGAVTVLPHMRGAAGQAAASFEPSPFLGAEDVDEEMDEATLPDPKPKKDDKKQEKKSPISTGLSTDERPGLDEFMWYLEGVYQDGVPSGAAVIDNLKYIKGGWKGLIVYDPEGEFGENAADFLNMKIDGKESKLSLTLDWYLMAVSDEAGTFDVSDMEDSVFKGKWKDGALWASGPGTIRLTQFYEWKGKQYAIGTMETPDGMPAVCALVRP